MIIYTLGIIEKNSKILFLLRQNTPFFSGHYGLPGGKIDSHESPAHALIREIHEELGIIITQKNLQFAHCLSFKNETNKEIIALVFNIIDWQGLPFEAWAKYGEPINKEPNKCAELTWFSLKELPENVIPRHRQVVEMIQKGILYSENGW